MPNEVYKPTLNRRRFLQLITGLGATAIASVGYVRVVEPRWLSVEHIEIPLPNLPAALDGKQVAQISDIHLSQFFSQERLAIALDEVAKLAPDWLVMTGDFVGNNAEDAEGLVEPLRRLPMPVYAIYGNHDYWSDNATVQRYLRAANVHILRNESHQIANGFWLAGVDDVWSGRPDLTATLRDIPSGAATVLLAHEPDFFDTVLLEDAPVTLQLSGHSHGGQIRIPTTTPDPAGNYSYAPVLPQYGRRYPIGLRAANDHFVYTNRGLGTWPVPYRLNCRPEVTIVTLRST